jgi:hypothetical protein
VHRYNKSKTTEQKFVEGFLKGLWWIISWPFKLIFNRGKSKNSYQTDSVTSTDQRFVNDKLQEIDMLMGLGKPSNFSKAILDADKLLDHILKGFRAPGLTMGDRLKSSRKRFSPENYEAAWKAHKVRNEIVHNSQYEIMDYQAKETIDNYKKAIRELV